MCSIVFLQPLHLWLEWNNILHLSSYFEDIISLLVVLIYIRILRNLMSTNFLFFMMTLSSFSAMLWRFIWIHFCRYKMVLVIYRFRSSFISIKILNMILNIFCPTFTFLLQGYQICASCILNIRGTHPLNFRVEGHEKWEPTPLIRSFLAASTVYSLRSVVLLFLRSDIRTTHCSLSHVVALFLF